ncbi:MAG TPA: thioredoxin family protein [Steroidobacteraceae bacterium]|nr:thioredoxin family protein [Steroidobacteraceae bacterium]
MKHPRFAGGGTLLGVALLLLSCSRSPTPAGPPVGSAPGAAASTAAPLHADAAGIDWYRGEVSEAFSAARTAHKPILLYWGAIWCPPCQELKSTVFSRPDFIARSRLFLPVYLDGDEAGAQKWGEKFHVSGYPTLVVLNADGRELMRIAGGMDLNQYATVLDTALADLQPADDLLGAAVAGKSLDAMQCRRLAFNSWELDVDASDDAATNARMAQQLDAAAEKCPAKAQLERARLEIFAADYATKTEADALKSDQPPSAALRAHLAEVDRVLADERLALQVADALQYFDENFFRAVKAGGATAAARLARFSKIMDAATADPDFSEADQLSALGSKLEAIKTVKGAIPAGVARAASARVAATLAQRQIPYVRSGIINAVLPIFELLNDNERAYKLVQGELAKTATPYYYKADLGELAESLGRKDEALKWYSEGYSEARGIATRFQWGAIYASGMLRLAPDNAAKISEVTSGVLGELDGPDRIYRRGRMRLVRLDKALRKWDTDAKGAHHEVIVALRARMQQICVKVPAAEPAHATCEAFLAGA